MTSRTALDMLKKRKRSRRLNLFNMEVRQGILEGQVWGHAYTNGANANARSVSTSNSTTTGSAYVIGERSGNIACYAMKETDHRSQLHD